MKVKVPRLSGKITVILISAMIVAALSYPWKMDAANAEEVTFIIPNSSNPDSIQFFDPPIQIVSKDSSIVFVNADSERHQLVVSDSNNNQLFDTGVLEQNRFVSHTFSELGEYSLQCKIFPHMQTDITVTDDIATLVETIPQYNMDVQLTWSPANFEVGKETFFKLVFIDKNTGRNHPHIDYVLNFNNSKGESLDNMGGHTVDGAEYRVFSFPEAEDLSPQVSVTGIDFVPIEPSIVTFETITVPEFSALFVAFAVAASLSAAILLGRRLGVEKRFSPT